jgi:uncharacterized membrane protein YkoI
MPVLTTVMLAMTCVPAQAGCVPWKSAGALISQNNLLPGNVIYQMVQTRTGGTVISATLCESGGKFVYKVVVLSKTGDSTNLSVNAKTGQF